MILDTILVAILIVSLGEYIRLAALVSVISFTSLARSHWGVIDELQEMLSESGNDGKLLAVFTERIELVSESCLQLLAGDVGQLGFGDK